MAGLSELGVLRAWEVGAGQHPLVRALTMVAAGDPSLESARVANLSVGQRNAALLALHEGTFGPDLEAFADCPGCRERLELKLNAADIRAGADSEPAQTSDASALEAPLPGGYRVRFRLPTSDDLFAVAAERSQAAGYRRLLARCVLNVEQDGHVADVRNLPERTLALLAERMAEADPQAEVLLDLRCPACGDAWQAPLDVGELLWAALAAEARRLLGEVHALARAYGWHEADILAMSPRRRRSYLELVEA